MAEKILLNEFKTLSKEKWVNIELDHENILEWNVALMILNPDSMYHGGYFKAKMKFPTNYPYSPPEFEFVRPLFHPNIYRDGRLCISILHPPGDDAMSGETAAERWSPIQRVESVLLSIISLLDDAEISSPANVDAAVMLRDEKELFICKVKEAVEASKKDIPEGFVLPEAGASMVASHHSEKFDDKDFWYDSDEGDFGGSESDEGLMIDADDDEDMEDAEDAEEDNEDD